MRAGIWAPRCWRTWRSRWPSLRRRYGYRHPARAEALRQEPPLVLATARPGEQGLSEGDAVPRRATGRMAGPRGSALAAAHILGTSHRDLKPENIMLPLNGTVVSNPERTGTVHWSVVGSSLRWFEPKKGPPPSGSILPPSGKRFDINDDIESDADVVRDAGLQSAELWVDGKSVLV